VRHIFANGGGPGTTSQLLIIDEFMTQLAFELNQDEDELHPANYFHLVGDVGFGARVLRFLSLGPHIVLILLPWICRSSTRSTSYR
jgi:hypothetical protein